MNKTNHVNMGPRVTFEGVAEPLEPALDPVTAVEPSAPFPLLSARERQIAVLLATGYTNREIGDNLGISVKTVDTHRGHILKKLDLRNNVELAREALRVGLVTLDDVD